MYWVSYWIWPRASPMRMDDIKDRFEYIARLQDEEETSHSHRDDDDEKAPSDQLFTEDLSVSITEVL